MTRDTVIAWHVGSYGLTRLDVMLRLVVQHDDRIAVVFVDLMRSGTQR